MFFIKLEKIALTNLINNRSVVIWFENQHHMVIKNRYLGIPKFFHHIIN